MSKGLEKAKELAKKTNAAVVVVNETTDEVFVVMSLEEFEKLVDKRHTTDDLRQATNDQQLTTSDRRSTTATVTDKSSVISRKSLVKAAGESLVASRESSVSLAALTEEELLARINQEIAEWRSNQADKENIVLAKIPANLSLKNEKGAPRGEYNLSPVAVDFSVDHREEEERFFLESLD